SAREERQPVLADLELVPVGELGRLDPAAVDEGAVEAAEILDEPAAVALDEDGVPARHRDVVEEDRAVRRAADRRALALRSERLPRAAAARTDDERGAFEAQLLELGELVALVGAEALRLLRGLGSVQEGTALRAVVGGLRILEAALGTVDVCHYSEGGAALPARMAVSDSTSTWLRIVSGPAAFSRAWYSARRMSIFPCRSRR